MKTDRETAGIGGEREAEGGTRSFPQFDLEHLRGFKQYLQGNYGGGNKPAKSAHEAAVDVSKYLRLVLLFYFFTLLE